LLAENRRAAATATLHIVERFLSEAAPLIRNRKLGHLVDRADRKIAAAFRQQGQMFLEGFARLRSAFRETESTNDWQRAFDTAALMVDALLIDAIDELASASLLAGATEMLADLSVIVSRVPMLTAPADDVTATVGVSFDLANPRAVHYLTRYGADRVRQIDETTRAQIRTIVTDGVDQGLSYTTIAGQLRQAFATMSAERARLIAVTEAGNAYSAGSLAAAQELQAAGVPMLKSWLTVHDELVDPNQCEPNEAEGWIPLDQVFQSGHERPLAHPRCRCVLQLKRAPGV
jgi:hypothetical protein